jgi:hypothetical protein
VDGGNCCIGVGSTVCVVTSEGGDSSASGSGG